MATVSLFCIFRIPSTSCPFTRNHCCSQPFCYWRTTLLRDNILYTILLTSVGSLRDPVPPPLLPTSILPSNLGRALQNVGDSNDITPQKTVILKFRVLSQFHSHKPYLWSNNPSTFSIMYQSALYDKKQQALTSWQRPTTGCA
jgi:hypothetical protein